MKFTLLLGLKSQYEILNTRKDYIVTDKNMDKTKLIQNLILNDILSYHFS